MAALTKYRYRFWCVTDSKYVYIDKLFADSAPTDCPDNAGHTIDANQTAISESV